MRRLQSARSTGFKRSQFDCCAVDGDGLVVFDFGLLVDCAYAPAASIAPVTITPVARAHDFLTIMVKFSFVSVA